MVRVSGCFLPSYGQQDRCVDGQSFDRLLMGSHPMPRRRVTVILPSWPNESEQRNRRFQASLVGVPMHPIREWVGGVDDSRDLIRLQIRDESRHPAETAHSRVGARFDIRATCERQRVTHARVGERAGQAAALRRPTQNQNHEYHPTIPRKEPHVPAE